MTLRTTTETIQVEGNDIRIVVETNDGLSFVFYADLEPTQTVKEFEDKLSNIRKKAYARRVWLNKRRSLSLDEINQLLAVE